MKKYFTLYWPGLRNIHLTKDVGIIPYIFQKHLNYEVTILCNKNEENYDKVMTKDINLNFMESEDSIASVLKKTDILMLIGYYDFNLNMIERYKAINPNGKIYLKLDLNRYWLNRIVFNEYFINLLNLCTLITVESKNLKKIIDNNWPIKVEYIPNGFYDFFNSDVVEYSSKENIILTVGRLGTYEKATEIVMEAFMIASDKINDWKLKLIGPIESEFNQHISNYFKFYPKLQSKVIFTGPIYDRNLLMEEYKKSKIFCLTSRVEAFAQVFGEAAFNGNFVISSDVDGALDITSDKKYGSIFPINDFVALSKELIDICSDDLRLKRICDDIQINTRNNFDWIKICEKINSFF
ncbi:MULTISPECIES: glycosyltransferase [unclassified Clostridium]|uniref:glycosyltransferase n=1 Tax=unclassified Clostridium TaxID=2614128 RepID=UPI0002986D9B|nr:MULTISPECIES: glycosyltransferase [unclassified Clostridium]EKQ54024.1 MAG: glycosyltransferase [Clostridium sp. Maddingley MBC34-26]